MVRIYVFKCHLIKKNVHISEGYQKWYLIGSVIYWNRSVPVWYGIVVPHGTRVPMVPEYHGTSMVVTSEWVSK